MIQIEDGYVKVKSVVAVLVGLVTIASIVLSPIIITLLNKMDAVEYKLIELEKQALQQQMCIDGLAEEQGKMLRAIEDIRFMREDIIKIKMALNIKD